MDETTPAAVTDAELDAEVAFWLDYPAGRTLGNLAALVWSSETLRPRLVRPFTDEEIHRSVARLRAGIVGRATGASKEFLWASKELTAKADEQ